MRGLSLLDLFQDTLLGLTLTEFVPIPHRPEIYYTIQIACEWTGIAVPTPVFDASCCFDTERRLTEKEKCSITML